MARIFLILKINTFYTHWRFADDAWQRLYPYDLCWRDMVQPQAGSQAGPISFGESD